MDKKSRAGLSEIPPVNTCKTCRWYAAFECVKRIQRAPQSWCYVEEWEENDDA